MIKRVTAYLTYCDILQGSIAEDDKRLLTESEQETSKMREERRRREKRREKREEAEVLEIPEIRVG